MSYCARPREVSHCTRTPNLLTLTTVPLQPVRFMRTRWPGFAAFHSGHVVVEFTIAVWRRLRSFARCVERHPAADPVSRRAGRLRVVPR